MIYLFYLEGYRAFLGAHSSMNQIQSYMKQIPQHVETVKKILSSKASPRLVSRMLPRSVNNIERIGNTCVTLAKGAERSFVVVLDLIGEVIEVIKVTQGGYEDARRRGRIELNVTRVVHEDMKREEAERRKHYEEVRETVRKAQQEYSQALKDIPTGFKALALEIGRAVVKVAHCFGQLFVSSQGGLVGLALGAKSILTGGRDGGAAGGNPSQGFGNSQIINFAARFGDSLNGLIQALDKTADETSTEDDNRTSSKRTNLRRNTKELESYKIIFNSYRKMVNIFPLNELKIKASSLIQRGIESVNQGISDKNADIIEQLKALSDELRPFLAAEQMNSNNAQSLAVATGGGSFNNELLKARLAEGNLARQEQRLDAYYANHLAAMEQIRQVTEKLARLNIEEVHFTQIIELLEEAFELLAELQKNWSNLVLFFSGFANQVVSGFGEKLKSFVGTARDHQLDAESSDTDREVILEFLSGDASNLYHESYILYVLSRTYYDVSSKYLMPRLSKLSTMLASKTNDERRAKLTELRQDTTDVENQVKVLIEERKRMFKQAVDARRAQITEVIDEQGADGDEDEIIEEAKCLGLS